MSLSKPSDIEKTTVTVKVRFPAGTLRPHDVRAWRRAIESSLTDLKLTYVAERRLEPGMFKTLWAPETIADPPDLPDKPTFSEEMSWRTMRDKVEERKAENARILEQRDAWWRRASILSCRSCLKGMHRWHATT